MSESIHLEKWGSVVDSNLPEKILLVDRSLLLVSAWRNVFRSVSRIKVHEGDFFQWDADAMVSPANSFGIMDGGLDLPIREHLGFSVQKDLQKIIVDQYHGELPVGCAIVVSTSHKRWPYLVSAPTMRVPESVAYTLNPYYAFRAALLAVRRFNQDAGSPIIKTMLCPGLATWIGRVDPKRCAAQMSAAFKQVARPAEIPTFEQIHTIHKALKNS
ncbi:MAG: macro domain-containing protein [Acidobacteriota bacterium]|nr:macro domain-containing protein [Acidobacteriota bacterium]